MTEQTWLTGYLDQVRALVRDHGHAVQFVFGGRPDEQFSYTVGLTAVGRPELWVGSLNPRQAGPILNDLARNEPPDALVHGAVLGADRWSIAFRIRGPVDTGHAALGVAERLYPDSPVTCLQVLWPDPAGLYPDDDGYDQAGMPQVLLPLAVGAG